MNFKLNIYIVIVLFAGLFHSAILAEIEKPQVISYDAIMELDSPITSKYVVLFVRYCIVGDKYKVDIAWAEPHIGALNYCLYPVTLSVDSEPMSFSTNSQLSKYARSAFKKPINKRGPFTYLFNAYKQSLLNHRTNEFWCLFFVVANYVSVNLVSSEFFLTTRSIVPFAIICGLLTSIINQQKEEKRVGP